MRLGLLTGGGDCAGLNAAVRAVVRTAQHRYGTTVVGYRRGWNGILDDDRVHLDADAVRGILPHGGTILGTSRSQPGLFAAGAGPIIDRLRADGVEALVAIGGDGTLMTTNLLHEAGFPVVAIPKTIDNDVEGTDVSIGFNTALSVATEAVDRLHTTATSHDRVMVLEVMGRHAGHLAAGAAVAGGAAVVLVPEQPFVIDEVAEALRRRHETGRFASIVVVAEGAVPAAGSGVELEVQHDAWGKPVVGGIGDLVGRFLEQATGFETRTTVLGHIQRGGSPTAADRLVGSRLGVHAVEALQAGHGGSLVGVAGDGLSLRPLAEVAGRTRVLTQEQVARLLPLTTAA